MSFVERGDGRLAYRVRGAGRAVLWIQGVGVHGDGWRPQVDELAARFRCVTFDHRGLGSSDAPRGALTVASLAADALAVLDAERIESAHVVGHSLGGLVAQELALGARTRVKSLALLCTFANGREVGRSARMAWLGLRTVVGTAAMRRNAFLEIVLSRGELAACDRVERARELAELFGHDLAVQPPVVSRQLAALRACDVRPRIAALAGLPTWVVSADEDPIAPPRLGRALADAVPGARFDVEVDAAHGLPIEHAGRLNPRLAEHFERAS
ncbi:MAG: alpha/beta hydrolase [Planctomycetes bacterium]|nr:alpha/beta hydrolase [Planctomycetota bacterium]